MFNLTRLPFFSKLAHRHKPQALMSDAEITALVSSLHLDHQQDSTLRTRHLYAGAQQSSHRGEGMDFLENRQYVVGDNPGHINWRLSARLGHLHTRVFLEEKQSQTIVLVDRRPTMWFGTQQQLKVSQAIRSAILFMFAATKRHHAFAVLQLEEVAKASDFQSGNEKALFQARQLARVDNRVNIEDYYASLAEALTFAQQVFPAGNEIIIISDFFDLDKLALATITEMSRHNSVKAIVITDPADTQLPHAGSLDTIATAAGDIVAIDTADPILRDHYQQVGVARQTARMQSLISSGAQTTALGTHQETWLELRGMLQ